MDKRIVIEGRKVHGVGYRPLLLGKARRLGLERYEAENVCINGSEAVDVSFGGEEKAVDEFAGFCRICRPQGALVSRVREDAPPEKVLAIDVYDKILAAEQQNTIVHTGLSMLDKQDKTIGKLDEFHKDTIQRFDVVDAKYGKIAGNLERILEEMKQERQEARKSTERIISMIAGMKSGGVVTERTAVYRASKKAKKGR